MENMVFDKPMPTPPGYSLAARLSEGELTRLSSLVASAPFVHRVLDSMPELVGVFTSTRQIIYANQAMRTFLGLEHGCLYAGPRPGELLKCIHAHESPHGCGNSLYCTQCGALRTIMESVTNREKAVGECRLTLDHEGREEPLDLYLWCAPFQVRGEDFSILAAVDISDRNRRRALERIFFHDLLNTFQRFYGLMGLLQDKFRDDAPDLCQQLTLAAEDLLEEVVSQKDLMAAESNELAPQPAKTDSVVLLSKLADRWKTSPWSCDREVALDPASQQVEFVCDQVLVKRVLSNMIKNALEAIAPGQKVTLSCRRQQDGVEFSVHNPGQMPNEVQLSIFQRSFSTKGQGRGLGSYSMRLLSTRFLEGRIDFRSTEEEGTTFYAVYPLTPSYAAKGQ